MSDTLVNNFSFQMAKRVATTQISDRNPYPTNESSESEEDSYGSQVADHAELARRK